MNRTELRDALTGLYNHTDDPRLIDEIRKVVEKVSAAHSSPAPSNAAIETIWTAAFTAACNIVIKRQNDLNDDDGHVDILNEQGAIISALKKWLVPDAVYLEELRGILGAASEPFQQRVQPWMLACFGAEISADVSERNHRFLEEALELVQSTGCTAGEAHQLVDYVFGREIGETLQEIGGVMVTLAALCLAIGQDMHAAGEIELTRIWTKVEKIRAKQAAKPKHSPLPQHVEAAADYVVWSNEHRAWWGANRAGYCTSLEGAGRYDREAALAICDGARGGRQYNDNPSEVPLLFADAERFWPNDKPEWREQRWRRAMPSETEDVA